MAFASPIAAMTSALHPGLGLMKKPGSGLNAVGDGGGVGSGSALSHTRLREDRQAQSRWSSASRFGPLYGP